MYSKPSIAFCGTLRAVLLATRHAYHLLHPYPHDPRSATVTAAVQDVRLIRLGAYATGYLTKASMQFSRGILRQLSH